MASPPSSRGPCPFHGEGDGGSDRRRLRGGAQPRASLTSPGSCCGATGPATRSPSYFQQDTAPVCFPVHSHRQTARQESRCRSRTWRRLSPPLTRRPRASGLPRHATEASAVAILSLAFQMRKKARGPERLAPSHLGNDTRRSEPEVRAVPWHQAAPTGDAAQFCFQAQLLLVPHGGSRLLGLTLSGSLPRPACPGVPAWHGAERRQALHKRSTPLRAEPTAATFLCDEAFPRHRASGLPHTALRPLACTPETRRPPGACATSDKER